MISLQLLGVGYMVFTMAYLVFLILPILEGWRWCKGGWGWRGKHLRGIRGLSLW